MTNNGTSDLTNLSLVDDFAGQFGGNFVAAVPGSVTVTNIDATTPPGANATYAGGATDNLLDGTGLLETGQSYTVTVIVEVDPDADPAALVNGALVNTATTTGDAPDGTTVSDVSDDPTVATDVDPNNDNNPDDPTSLFFSSIGLTKTAGAIVPAASGTAGNFDVTYTFVVTNTGAETLNNLTLVDDFGSQLGGNFIAAIPGSVVAVSYTHLTLPTIYSV